MVLMSQPVFALGGAMAVLDRVGIPAPTAADPERGCRYSGSDLTSYVPIFINGTSDFVSQGWPGSGNPGDPYVISRLNITYDVGLVGIRVVDTQAYFVIRDCFVKQVSSLVCIELYNASHAAIEYATAISPGPAITCEYTNNLQISQSVATAGSNMALTMDSANNTVLQWNLFSSTSRRGLLAEYCDDLQSEHNEYMAANTLYSCVYLRLCDRASSQYDYSYQGNAGFAVADSEDVTILGFEGEDNQIGITIGSAPRIAISDCIITNAADNGFELDSCPNSTIDQCALVDCGTAAGNYGIYIYQSGDTQVTDTQVLRSSGRGIYVRTSDRVTLDHNHIDEAAVDGLYLQDSENLTVTDNEIMGAGDLGLFFTGCARGDVQANTVSNVGGMGMYFDASDYINVYGNDISDAVEAGFWIEGGIEANVVQNTVEMCETGIGLVSHANGTVDYNTVASAVTGVYFEVVSGTALDHNTIVECRTGVQLVTADLCSIEDNTIEECWETGIWLQSGHDITVRGNLINGPTVRGDGIPNVRAILVTFGRNLVFDSNRMSEYGLLFAAGLGAQYYNHSFTGNLVNGLPLYYGLNISEVALAGSALGQVILVQCEDVSVTGGTFHRCTAPIQSFYSESLDFVGITSDENYAGFWLSHTSNSTISGATVTESYYGSHADHCDFLTIENTHVSHGIFRGAEFTFSTDMTIRSLTVEYAQQGIYAEVSANGSVTDSWFRHISQMGVILNAQSDYWNLTGCEFFNCSTGLRADSTNALIVESKFERCGYAIYDYGTWGRDGTVVRSEFYSNGEAIHLYLGDNWNIINSTILWSESYGIYLMGSTGPEIYGNTIALSGTANGYSNVVQYWDDGVSRGNSWDDYVAPPPYEISGAGATDRYPSVFLPTEPIIDSPMDVYYAEFSTGNHIEWQPYDDFLSDWSVTIDGVAWTADAWNLDSIYVNIDGLSYGIHTVVVTVRDVDMNSITDEVIVHVYDGTPPTISHLPNTEAFFGDLGQKLTWDVSDLHPGSYEILRDDIEVSSGHWTTGNISTSLDGLTPGVHDYAINIYDLDGNVAHDQLTVIVLVDVTAPTIDSPADDIIIVGTVGNYITWTPEDDYPESYEVAKDGAVVEAGAWAGSKIAFSIDGLDVGNYNFTLTVYDGAGHSASDSVVVRVYPYGGYIPPTFDIVPWLVVGAVVGVVAVVVVLYFRRRGKY